MLGFGLGNVGSKVTDVITVARGHLLLRNTGTESGSTLRLQRDYDGHRHVAVEADL